MPNAESLIAYEMVAESTPEDATTEAVPSNNENNEAEEVKNEEAVAASTTSSNEAMVADELPDEVDCQSHNSERDPE